MTEKLSPWLRPSHRPVREGRYRAQDTTMNCNCCWIELEWRDGQWFSDLLTPGHYRTHFWLGNLKRWRGLAEKPIPLPKGQP